jgi:hypothetical protein
MRNNDPGCLKWFLIFMAFIEVAGALTVGYSIISCIVQKEAGTTLAMNEVYKFLVLSFLALFSGIGILLRHSMLFMANFYLIVFYSYYRIDNYLSFFYGSKIGYSQEVLSEIYRQELMSAIIAILLCFLFFGVLLLKRVAKYIGFDRKHIFINVSVAIGLIGIYIVR